MTLNDLLGYFPPHLDGTLIELMNDAPPPPHTAPPWEQDALDFRREIALAHVHRHFESESHEAAAEILRAAWREKAAFGLFLRNFSLGGQIGERTAEWIGTRVSTADARLQQHLLEEGPLGLPLVAIQNPAFDFEGDSYIPKLMLPGDEWLDVVRPLVTAAQLIVFYYVYPSAGVTDELELISGASRQEATVIVCDEGTVDDDLEPLRRRGFRHFVAWGTGTAASDLAGTVDGILRGPYEGAFTPLPPLEFRPAIPAEMQDTVTRVAGAAMQEAQDHARAGRIAEGENAVVRCLVLCCYGGYDEGRALAHLELARAQHYGRGKTILARANYDRAIEIYRRLALSSPTAARALRIAQEERATLPSE